LNNDTFVQDSETEGYHNTVPLTNNTFIIGQPMTFYSGVFSCQLLGETTSNGETTKFEISPIFYIEVAESIEQGEETEYPIDPNITFGIDEYIADVKEQAKSEIEATGEAVKNSIPSDYSTLSSEVSDIRTGADGTKYNSAGDAVRGQFSDLKSDLKEATDFIVACENLVSPADMTTGYQYQTKTGDTTKIVQKESANAGIVPPIKLRANVTYYITRVLRGGFCWLVEEDKTTLISKISNYSTYELISSGIVKIKPLKDCYLLMSYDITKNYQTITVFPVYLPSEYIPKGTITKVYCNGLLIYPSQSDSFKFAQQNNLLPFMADYSNYTQVIARPSSGFANAYIESPNVFWDSNKLKYGMVFVGYVDDGNGNRAFGSIGIAWSDDLENWTMEENPIFERNPISGQADSGSVTGPVMYIIDGVYYLYYVGCTDAGYEAGTKSLCLATSTDLVNWTRHENNPIISPSGVSGSWYGSQVYHPNILKYGGLYYMFINAKPYGSLKENIGYATSTDLINWNMSDSAVINFNDEESSYLNNIIGDPYLFDIGDNNIYMIYFTAGRINGSVTGHDCLAYTSKADFPSGWKQYSGNPITPSWRCKPSIIFKDRKMYHFFGGSGSYIGLYTS
jgi:predicted GH43/DUF377 family glycosyl hydrolase